MMSGADIRLREHIGYILTDTSIDEFNFFVIPIKNRIGIRVGDYVLVDHPEQGDPCPLLGVVRELRAFEEAAGSSIN